MQGESGRRPSYAVQLASISDTTPPEISVSVNPQTLWPPNHKMRTVQTNVVVTDNCPGFSFILSSVVSDEPDNGQGIGDGNTDNDIQNAAIGSADLEMDLRSERDKGQEGRTYTITYTASDNGNNDTEASASVTVAHDQN